MANLTMKNWRIVDKLPYIHLGSAGENNASTITITVDSLIENANYYLDIGDESGINLPNTQELTQSSNTGTNGENIYTLSMQPMVSWLGKEGNKLLQVRCVYVENDKQIVKESNVFHAIVDRNSGFVYKYDIAVFEEYLDKIKNSGGGTGDVTQEQLDELLDKQHIATEMPEPSEDLDNITYLYIGETNLHFTQGNYYKCVEDYMMGTFKWQLVNIPLWVERPFDEDNNNFELSPYDYYYGNASYNSTFYFILLDNMWKNKYDEAKIEINCNDNCRVIFCTFNNNQRWETEPVNLLTNKHYILTVHYDGTILVNVEDNWKDLDWN